MLISNTFYTYSLINFSCVRKVSAVYLLTQTTTFWRLLTAHTHTQRQPATLFFFYSTDCMMKATDADELNQFRMAHKNQNNAIGLSSVCGQDAELEMG